MLIKVYHGSFHLFDQFHQQDVTVSGGTFFTTNMEYAVNFGMYIYTCTVNIDKLMHVDILNYKVVTKLINTFSKLINIYDCILGNDSLFTSLSYRKSKGIEMCIFDSTRINIQSVYNVVTKQYIKIAL